jgi:prepilin-type N-terminal cleavage/methylation domain-containing protein
VIRRNMGQLTRVEKQVRKNIKRAFTLIELLTVIAITAILMTIIVLPIFQSFNLTRAAQAFSDAQDKARILIERIQREINNGAAIRDNSGLNGSLALRVPVSPGGVYGPPVLVTLPFVKLDIVRPAEGEPDASNPGVFRDPYSGKIDPTLKSPKGQTVLPVSQGFTLVRYFIGPRDPFIPYNNTYDGLLMARGGNRDNLFVLYRIEVQPRIWDTVDQRYETNLTYFEPDPTDPNGTVPIIDDRFFFIPDLDRNGNVLAGAPLIAKQQRVRNWLSKAVIQTEVSRYDMIQPLYNKANRQVFHDLRADMSDFSAPALRDRPRLLPLIQFKPTRVSGEPAEGKMVVRLGEEFENAKEAGPDVFTTAFGAWSTTTIRMYPSGWNRANAAFNEYLVARIDPADGHIKIFAFDPDSGTTDSQGGIAVFDITEYNRVVSNPTAADIGPFNTAVLPAANTVPNLFMAFLPDSALGKVLASFGIDSVRSTDFGTPLPGGAVMNQPVALTGAAFSPLNEPLGGTWDATTNINTRFNRIWNDPAYAALKPSSVHRYIDLRVTNQLDGSASPMDPAVGFGRAKIVPGTEVVIGPDQTPGPNYGEPVRYTRTTRAPGPNQYKINYVDLNEPLSYVTTFGQPNPPAAYTNNDFSSAVLQARFKAGYIQLNSDPNVPLPDGNIRIYYRFQFTGGRSTGSSVAINAPNNGAPQDAVAVDYDTRQLMSVLLTIRNYPQSNIPNPQTVTLSATAKVRNYLR